jgi:hypothetical protein
MRTAALLAINTWAYSIATYIAFGHDRAMVLASIKVWAFYILIMLMVSGIIGLLGYDK